MLGQLLFLDLVQDFAASSELDGAPDVATSEIGGVVYFLVVSHNDHRVKVLRMQRNLMRPIFAIRDSSAWGLAGA